MKSLNVFLLWAVFGIMHLFPSSAQAQATLYVVQHAGADGLSTLYTANPTSGATTMVGAIGFERCGAMDSDATGTLYAACERADGSNTPVLITIDPNTGAGTEIGPTGINGAIGDISFRGADGTLFAFDAFNDPQHTLFTLDTGTGAATLVGDTGLSADGGNGMTFDGADTLWHSARNGPDLNTLDQTSGVASFVTTLTMPAGLPPAARISAKDYNPVDGEIWGVLKEGQGADSPSDLVTVDTATGVVTLVAPTIQSLDALAWVVSQGTPRIVPALSPGGLVLLVGLFLLAALITQRRRLIRLR